MEQTGSHVPVFVDNPGYSRELGMTRLSYFYVECADSETTAPIESKDDLSILLLDLEGVIMSPFGGKELFDSMEAIAEVFDHIDGATPYVVSTSYIWLPNKLLRSCIEGELSRGEVLRVSTPLFIRACRHVRTPVELKTDDFAAEVNQIYRSDKETAAFKEWTERTVAKVRDRYHKPDTIKLKDRNRPKGE